MTEADTRAELIEPALARSGWGGEDAKVKREYSLRLGRLEADGKRGERLAADFVLNYKNINLAVVEAKKASLSYGAGVAQAKLYARLLKTRFAYATNGKEIYQIDMLSGEEKLIPEYPSPEELWAASFEENNQIWERLAAVPLNTDGRFAPRYYQENAVNAVMKAIASGRDRVLLTLATGTGKTRIAFQIVWKLTQAKWNRRQFGARAPRVLFLADRNILANQAFNTFGAFGEDALERINPDEIRKNGYKVPTSRNIFFTIFQTFMSGEEPYFGQYDKDFFDLVIIDECHRGGARDESEWRRILEHFSGAAHLGLTATPKRKDNVDTYKYFGKPVYEYKLVDAINDGYLTPFRVREIRDNFGVYTYDPRDCVEGEIDKERVYKEPDFNRNIELREREEARVRAFMSEINQNDKTIVFCATQNHAALVRDLINQVKTVTRDPDYCVRVTAEDGKIGDKYLSDFQNTDKTIPTILTTSQKLSTGVDAVQVKNIVLLRPVNSMIEFKQIIGRGTRLSEDKAHFTVYDFVGASKNFRDPEWDGEVEYVGKSPRGTRKNTGDETGKDGDDEPKEPREMIKIKLGRGREAEILRAQTSFYDKETGKVVSASEFVEKLVGRLPEFFASESELRKIWSRPDTRKTLLIKFEKIGYGSKEIEQIKQMLRAEDCDVFDVLEFLAEYQSNMPTRAQRASANRERIARSFGDRQWAFIEFVLSQYVKNGVGELSDERISELVKLKYGTLADATNEIGEIGAIREVFCGFQKYLYSNLN